jgi:hypothetical protein
MHTSRRGQWHGALVAAVAILAVTVAWWVHSGDITAQVNKATIAAFDLALLGSVVAVLTWWWRTGREPGDQAHVAANDATPHPAGTRATQGGIGARTRKMLLPAAAAAVPLLVGALASTPAIRPPVHGGQAVPTVRGTHPAARTGSTPSTAAWPCPPVGVGVTPPGVTGAEVLAFAPDGSLITPDGNGGLERWDAATCQPVATWKQVIRWPRVLALSASGQRMAAGDGMSHALQIWDLSVHPIRMVGALSHESPPKWAVFNPDGRQLATATWGGPLRLWNVGTQKRVAAEPNRGAAIAFSPDGKTLATADSSDNTIDIVTVPSMHTLQTFPGFHGVPSNNAVAAMAFSPDGKILAAVGTSDEVRLWDVGQSRPSTVLTGHNGHVNSMAFSPDGHTLATGSDDGTVMVWNLATKTTLTTLETQGATTVHVVAFNPDGRILAAGTDTSVTLWQAPRSQ